jgi:integrase
MLTEIMPLATISSKRTPGVEPLSYDVRQSDINDDLDFDIRVLRQEAFQCRKENGSCGVFGRGQANRARRRVFGDRQGGRYYHVVKRGKTPVLSPEEARRVLDAIDVTTHAGLRDRALIGLMVFSFARIGAALAMKVEDVSVQDGLHEKGGKRHEMPCHHNLETYTCMRIWTAAASPPS